MTKLWRSLRLWFATLPRIHWRWSRPKLEPVFAPVAPPAQVQNELSERMERVIEEAFADALQANRAMFNTRHATPDMLPHRPAKGDMTYAW
jgi:hypothetical protein